MKKSFFFTFLSIFFLFYYFFFPLEGGKEQIWTPVLIQDLAEADGKTFPKLDHPETIHNGFYSGILMPQGESVIQKSAGFRQTYSLSHIFSPIDGTSSMLVNRVNLKSTIVFIPGLPFIYEDHFFVMSGSGLNISEVDSNGELIWSWEGVSPVTAIAASDLLTALGFLDGTVALFKKDGSSKLLDTHTDSGDSVVYGLELSDDGEFLSVVTGMEEQNLFFFRKTMGMDYSKIAGFPLESHYDRPVRMVMNRTDHSVWLEQPGKLVCFNDEGQYRELDMNYPLQKMLLDDSGQMVFSSEKIRNSLSLMQCRSFSGELLFSEEASGVLSHFHSSAQQLSMILDNRFILFAREDY